MLLSRFPPLNVLMRLIDSPVKAYRTIDEVSGSEVPQDDVEANMVGVQIPSRKSRKTTLPIKPKTGLVYAEAKLINATSAPYVIKNGIVSCVACRLHPCYAIVQN